MHMCGTRTEKEVEICPANLANKTNCMSTNAKKWKKNCEDTTCLHKILPFFALVLMHLVC
jgi:hypothetical protein